MMRPTHIVQTELYQRHRKSERTRWLRSLTPLFSFLPRLFVFVLIICSQFLVFVVIVLNVSLLVLAVSALLLASFSTSLPLSLRHSHRLYSSVCLRSHRLYSRPCFHSPSSLLVSLSSFLSYLISFLCFRCHHFYSVPYCRCHHF